MSEEAQRTSSTERISVPSRAEPHSWYARWAHTHTPLEDAVDRPGGERRDRTLSIFEGDGSSLMGTETFRTGLVGNASALAMCSARC